MSVRELLNFGSCHHAKHQENILILDLPLLGGALRLGPAQLALHLLQQGGQQVVHWLESFGVTLLGQRDIIEHVVVRDTPVNLQW